MIEAIFQLHMVINIFGNYGNVKRLLVLDPNFLLYRSLVVGIEEHLALLAEIFTNKCMPFYHSLAISWFYYGNEVRMG